MTSFSKQDIFKKGLIVGKFSPLHRGHEYLIDYATNHCDELILISYSKPEFKHCSRPVRQQWLNTRFPELFSFVIDDQFLAEFCQQRKITCRNIPTNDAPDNDHRLFVAWLCLDVLNTIVDIVFTSESYGDGFANVLTDAFQQRDPGCNVEHRCLDIHRSTIPISATQIRQAPHQHQEFLAPEVMASFIKKLCILGGESSGKTTLARELADALNTEWVPEYGRALWEKQNGQLTYPDMLHIAITQLQHETTLTHSAQHWLICDTSPLTTLYYSEQMFQKADPELIHLALTTYDFIIVCDPHIDFIQDGTRQNPAFRQAQHEWFVTTLQEQQRPFLLVHGSVNERIEQVLTALPTETY